MSGTVSVLNDRISHLLNDFGLSNTDHKPTLAVSACLLGQPVRYDGDHKSDPLITDLLANYFHYQPLCPEVAIGMSVPRPPIQVVDVDNQQRVQKVASPHEDVTDALRQFALSWPEQVDGFILKARSPSCGVGSTPLHDDHGNETGTLTNGMAAATFMERFPALPILDEQALSNRDHCLAFITHSYCYNQWRTQQATSDQIARWQQLCRAQNHPAFIALADRMHHWRGVAVN